MARSSCTELLAPTSSARTGGGASIWLSLDLSTNDGSALSMNLTGWGAEVAEEKLSSCRPGQRVRLEVLAHLEKVLEVACE